MREIRIQVDQIRIKLKTVFLPLLVDHSFSISYLVSRLKVYRFIGSLPIILRLSLQLSVEI